MRPRIKASRLDEPGSDGSPEIEEITLSEQVYRLLRRDIMSGAFAPGQSLRLELLKQRYGSSFSPIREALNRLRSERMVVSTTSRGFRIAPLSVEEMWDACETRILIDCEALRRSLGNADDAWEARLVGAYHALTLAAQRAARPSAGPGAGRAAGSAPPGFPPRADRGLPLALAAGSVHAAVCADRALPPPGTRRRDRLRAGAQCRRRAPPAAGRGAVARRRVGGHAGRALPQDRAVHRTHHLDPGQAGPSCVTPLPIFFASIAEREVQYNARASVADFDACVRATRNRRARARAGWRAEPAVRHGPGRKAGPVPAGCRAGVGAAVRVHPWRLLALAAKTRPSWPRRSTRPAPPWPRWSTLLPEATLPEVVREVRSAVTWLYRNAAAYGVDPARIYVSGSSAGGHLAGMLARRTGRRATACRTM